MCNVRGMARARFDRRILLAATGMLAVAAYGLGRMWRGAGPAAERRTLTDEERARFAAIQARLLPRDASGPGAPDVHATTFLEAALRAPSTWMPRVRLVRAGGPWLDAWARRHGAAAFVGLRDRAQDDALRAYEATPQGVRWMRVMIEITLEAFLCDPARGGNPDGIGWAWARHRPGWPRPPSTGWRPTERT